MPGGRERRIRFLPRSLLLPCLAALLVAASSEPVSAEATNVPRFLGEQSCASSGCHGGAKADLNQFTSWKERDVHTRAYATLTTPRSQRIGDLLKIGPPAAAARCTTCHAPFQEVPASLRDAKVRAETGVSCESCHGAAESWLRSHTRPDFTHADRVTAGLRDLKNPYQRANTCVACHQHLEPDLRNAGHPPLIFELDGQCVTQPRHWRERPGRRGGQLWLVGQAVALREMSWHLERASSPDPAAVARWQGLVWLLQHAATAMTNLPPLAAANIAPTPSNFQHVRELSDAMARRAADLDWSLAFNERLLRELAGVTNDFLDATLPRLDQASRAERLVLGLDRLFVTVANPQAAAPAPADAEAALQSLFKEIQSAPDFDSATFARRLAIFKSALPPASP